MTDTTDIRAAVLEPAAQAFVEATNNPPYLFQLPPEEGRKGVDDVQSGDVDLVPVDEEWLEVPGASTGSVPVRVVRPKSASGVLPVILYIHGAGWVFGDAHTHDRLVREVAAGTGAAVVFPEYSLRRRQGPRRQPVRHRRRLRRRQHDHRHHPPRQRARRPQLRRPAPVLSGDRRCVRHRLLSPVAEGYYLCRDGMQWFWDQYTTDETERANILASPRRATAEQLAGLPQALVITAEADVLRDEGEAYAAHLRAAGVPVTAVRYGGIIHDFVMLNALRDSRAADAAIAQAVEFLRRVLTA